MFSSLFPLSIRYAQLGVICSLRCLTNWREEARQRGSPAILVWAIEKRYPEGSRRVPLSSALLLMVESQSSIEALSNPCDVSVGC
jgi:hypothetical protein